LTDDAPVAAADRERLQAFLEALRRACPAEVAHELAGQAQKAAQDLQGFDPLRHLAAVNARADRLALVVTGDLAAALSVVAYLEGSGAPADRPWELPSARALIEWAFSDEYLALRREAAGESLK